MFFLAGKFITFGLDTLRSEKDKTGEVLFRQTIRPWRNSDSGVTLCHVVLDGQFLEAFVYHACLRLFIMDAKLYDARSRVEKGPFRETIELMSFSRQFICTVSELARHLSE